MPAVLGRGEKGGKAASPGSQSEQEPEPQPSSQVASQSQPDTHLKAQAQQLSQPAQPSGQSHR